MWVVKLLRYLAIATILILVFVVATWYSAPYWIPSALPPIARHYDVNVIDIQASKPSLSQWGIHQIVLELPSKQRIHSSGITINLADATPTLTITIDKLHLTSATTKADRDTASSVQPLRADTLLKKIHLPDIVNTLRIDELTVEYSGTNARGQLRIDSAALNQAAQTTLSFAGDITSSMASNATSVKLTADLMSDFFKVALELDGVHLNSRFTRNGEKWLAQGDFSVGSTEAAKYINLIRNQINASEKLKDELQLTTIDGTLSGKINGVLPNNIEDKSSLQLAVTPTLTASAKSDIHGDLLMQGGFELGLSAPENKLTLEVASLPWHVQVAPKSANYAPLPKRWMVTPLNTFQCQLNDQLKSCLSHKQYAFEFEGDNSSQAATELTISNTKGRVSFDAQDNKGEVKINLTVMGDGLKLPKRANIASTFQFTKKGDNWLVTSPITSIAANDLTVALNKISTLTTSLTNTQITINPEKPSKSLIQTTVHTNCRIVKIADTGIAKHLPLPIDVNINSKFSISEKEIRINKSSAEVLGAGLTFEGAILNKNASNLARNRPSDWRSHEGSLLLLAEITPENATLKKFLNSFIKSIAASKNISFRQGNVMAKGSFNWSLQEDKLSYNAQLASRAADWEISTDKTKVKGVDVTTAMFIDDSRFELSSPLEINAAEIDIGVPVKAVNVQITGAGQFHGPAACQVNLNKARGSAFGGSFRLVRPFTYDCAAFQENLFKQTAFVEIHQLNLEKLVQLENENIVAKGEISGLIPITLTNDKVFVNGGQVAAINPGYIKLLESAGWKSIASGNEQFLFAIDALEDFHYKSLVSRVDYLENDQLKLGITLQGANPKVHRGKEIIYNLNIETNILSLLKSIELADDITEKLSNEYR